MINDSSKKTKSFWKYLKVFERYNSAFRIILAMMLVATQWVTVGFAQNISLKVSKVSLETVLKEIRKQGKIQLAYNADLLNSKDLVSIRVDNQPMEEVLSTILHSQGLDFQYKDNLVVITPRKENPKRSGKIDNGNNAQQERISGQLVDDQKNPLAGISVTIKGTTKATSTDQEGAFEIEAEKGDVLVFSSIGYLVLELEVGKDDFKEVVLLPSESDLEEVVIVGYGSSTKRSLITSVSSVKAEELEELPVQNITQALAGRAPGLVVQSGSGLNSKASISIRGGGDPIYVIDGVIRSSNDFANLNSDDIESISVLKDASSTAVYGARAADGIIQVVTKRGKDGQPSVNYSFNQTWGQPSFWADRVDSYTNALKVNEALENEGKNPQYSEEALNKYLTGSDPGEYPNTDWKKAVLNNWAPMSKHNFSVTGGSEWNTYYTSLGYTDMNSLFKSGRYEVDRINYNLTNTTKIKETGLSVMAQLSGFTESSDDVYTSEGAGKNYIMEQVGMKAPYELGVNKYGLPYDMANNPVADASQDAGYMRSKSTIVNGLLNINWEVPWVEGLSARASGNYNWYDRSDKNFRKDAAKYGWDSTTPLYAAKPQLNLGNTQGYKWTLQYFVDYSTVVGDHSISGLAGYEAAYQMEKGLGLARYQYDLPIDQIGFGPTDDMDNSGWEAENGRAGFIGQVKYGYKSRYFLEGAFRRDGSDYFPKNSRWGNFYSISGGWILSDENFMQNLKDKGIINQLKLRGSYGQVGMDQGIDRFTYLDMYDFNSTGYVFDGKMYPTLTEGAAPSVNITWYQDNQYGLGMDFEGYNSKIYGNIDYFLFVTSGFMADPDPEGIGYIDPYGRDLPQVESNGEKRRAGLDFLIGYRNSIGDFKYDVGFNFTTYDVYWSYYPWESLDVRRNPYTRQSGQYDHFSQVGYHYIKTAESAREWMNYPQRQGSTNLTGGDFIYEDFNGDGRLTGDDQYRIGFSSKPLINYGIPIELGYKGFKLNLLVQGAGKRDLPISRTMWDYNYLTRYDYQLDYWRPDNRDAKFPRILSSQSVNGSNNLMPSEAWTFNGRYIRLKSLVLSYDLKHSLLKETPWFKSFNVALTGMNLFTISEATKFGIDPEVNNVMNAYPIERVLGLKLNVGF